MTIKEIYSELFLKHPKTGLSYTLLKFFLILLNPYVIALFAAVSSAFLATEYHRYTQAKDQKTEAIHMLENILSEMDYNIQKVDLLLPSLDSLKTLLETASQGQASIPTMSLSTGAFRAALTTGQLRYIPKYAFAIIAYYEVIETVNEKLETIRRGTGLTVSYKPSETQNLKHYVTFTIALLESLKKILPEMRGIIDRDKLLIVQDKIQPEVKRHKGGTLIFHPETSAVPDTSGVDVDSLSKQYFDNFLKLLYNLTI